jgi:ankyrin repeat protein
MAAEESDLDEIFFLMMQTGEIETFKSTLQEALSKTPRLLLHKNMYGMTLLHFAARNADIEAIESLIEMGADPAQRGGCDGKQTALHYAASKSYFFAIYLKIFIKNLGGKDLTSLLMEVLPKGICSEINLLRALQQITLSRFESTLWEILEQCKLKGFSYECKHMLKHVQTQMKQRVFYQKSISTLMLLLQHTNTLEDFQLLLNSWLSKIDLKISHSLPSSPRIMLDSSSPILSRREPEENSDLEETLAEDYSEGRGTPHPRRKSVS